MEGIKMAKYGMVIDISRCTACYCCFAACKDEYWENDYPPYSAAQPRFGQFWINPIKTERGPCECIKIAYVPHLCQHCDDAPCMKVAKDGAIQKGADGIVVFDLKKAVGQKQIVDACPYKIVFWNEEKNLPQKCTFCAHRLKEGKEPRCAQICPSGAIMFGDLNDSKSEVAKLVASGKVETLRPDLDTKPRVYYMNLPKIFIAGSVIFGDKNECAEGAVLTLAGAKTATTTANAFGDFIFDGLAAGKYTVKIEAKGYASKSMDIDLKTDNYLGAISLSKS
jgi:Fe-S-cluster-containing dehydrogenase component